MKNYKVRITRNFTDNVEKVERKLGTETEEFLCTKERYEYLASCNGAVELVEIVEEKENNEKKPEIVYEMGNSKITVGNNEIKFEAKEIVEEQKDEEAKDKPKKKSNRK